MGRLREEADRISREVPGVRLFAFGSVLCSDSWPADVDMLVIYESPDDVSLLRLLLEPLSRKMPLHLLFLSRAEEAQLQFVIGERCVPLR